jgi:hypothetical protein
MRPLAVPVILSSNLRSGRFRDLQIAHIGTRLKVYVMTASISFTFVLIDATYMLPAPYVGISFILRY